MRGVTNIQHFEAFGYIHIVATEPDMGSEVETLAATICTTTAKVLWIQSDFKENYLVRRYVGEQVMAMQNKLRTCVNVSNNKTEIDIHLFTGQDSYCAAVITAELSPLIMPMIKGFFDEEPYSLMCEEIGRCAMEYYIVHHHLKTREDWEEFLEDQSAKFTDGEFPCNPDYLIYWAKEWFKKNYKDITFTNDK